MSLLRPPEGERRTVLAPFPLALHYRETLSHRLLEVIQIAGFIKSLVQADQIFAVKVLPLIIPRRNIQPITRHPNLGNLVTILFERDGKVGLLIGKGKEHRLNEVGVLADDCRMNKIIDDNLLIHIEEFPKMRLILGTQRFRFAGGKVPEGPEKSYFIHDVVELKVNGLLDDGGQKPSFEELFIEEDHVFVPKAEPTTRIGSDLQPMPVKTAMIQGVVVADLGFEMTTNPERDRDTARDGICIPNEDRLDQDGVLACQLLVNQIVDHDRLERVHIDRNLGIILFGVMRGHPFGGKVLGGPEEFNLFHA